MNPHQYTSLALAVRTRLRERGVRDLHAEASAERLLAAHFERLPSRPAPPLLWRDGFGEPAFELLLDYLSSCPPASEAFEWIVTDLREALLRMDYDASAPADRPRLVELAAALAVQAFRAEYVWAESPGEAAAVAALEGAAQLSPFQFAVLGAYRPLHRLAARAPAATGAALELLVRVQVSEPLAEAALKPAIRVLTPIEDAASKAVREQYEQNPYPRWHHLPPLSPVSTAANAPRERQLIAGCGTGQHPIGVALQQPQVDFLAVDLSLASLAYAKRKAAEYGLTNLEFAQADLLRLPDTGLRFDAISCVGVLHHLARPVEGLSALRGLMSGPRGLKVAVYTESGRKAMVAAMRLREEFGLPATAEGIREFRQVIYALPASHPARGLLETSDFYSVSGCRDMAFHVVEHRYTLPAFAALVEEAGLRIEAFLPPEDLKARFAATDLERWHAFEDENPGVFGSMYRFLLNQA